MNGSAKMIMKESARITMDEGASIPRAGIVNRTMHGIRINLMLPLSHFLIERWGLLERFPMVVTKIHLKVIALHGSSGALVITKRLFSEIIAKMIFLCVISIALGGLIEPTFFLGALCMPLFIPLLYIRDLDKKLKLKKRRLIIEMPEFLNKLSLLIDAGESIQQAIIRCVEHKKLEQGSKEPSPLFRELVQMTNELKNNRSFQQAMEDFNKRCQLQEVSIFTTTVLLNYHRGGEQLVLSLRDLSRIVWERRKAVSQTLGEEASSKLVFPMVFIFFIVMVIIAAPAILLMNQN